MSTGGYPLGAQYDKRAPYNETKPDMVNVDVCVSLSIHKNMTLKVPEGYDESALRDAVESRIAATLEYLYDDNDWNEDEFEVVLE